MTIPQQPSENPQVSGEQSVPQPAPAPQPAASPPPQAQPAPPPGTYYGAPPTPKTATPAGPRRKSPAVACILSIIPGLGQIYVGYYGLGFLHAIVAAAIFAILVNNDPSRLALFPMLVMFFTFFLLYNIVDAGRRAALYNLAIAGVPGVDLPQPLKVPRFGGSIFGGAVLIIAGFILLMHTKYGFSLTWLEEWWPVGPMIFGAYLIYRAVQDRAAKAD